MHESGPTRIIPFDLSAQMHIDYPATSPNLIASFLRICKDESLETKATATSQAFYVIRGRGTSVYEEEEVQWHEGDLFVVPASERNVQHSASSDSALYWVNDQPLMTYLGVAPIDKKFNVTLFKRKNYLLKLNALSINQVLNIETDWVFYLAIKSQKILPRL